MKRALALLLAALAMGCGGDDDPPPVTKRVPRIRPQHLGRTIDEALPLLDKFLDDAALSGRVEIRVVHGHGTGRLRSAVRQFLSGHPHVESYRPGAPYEGGDGATVVRLK